MKEGEKKGGRERRREGRERGRRERRKEGGERGLLRSSCCFSILIIAVRVIFTRMLQFPRCRESNPVHGWLSMWRKVGLS